MQTDVISTLTKEQEVSLSSNLSEIFRVCINQADLRYHMRRFKFGPFNSDTERIIALIIANLEDQILASRERGIHEVVLHTFYERDYQEGLDSSEDFYGSSENLKPDQKKAFELLKESGYEITLRSVAQLLGIPKGVIMLHLPPLK